MSLDDTRILLDDLDDLDDTTLVDVHCWIEGRREDTTRSVDYAELARILDAASR